MSGQDSPEAAAAFFLKAGVRQVFISLGASGLYCSDGRDSAYLPAPPLPPVPLTGAGDAMTAGLALALAEGLPILEAARLGTGSANHFLKNQLARQAQGAS